MARPAPSFLLLAALVAGMTCSQHVTRDRWQQMSSSEKNLYVNSLIGGEKAKAAKGGSGQRDTEPPETYVARIDDAYARGDRRDPDVIFAGLDDTRSPSAAH